MNMCIIVSERLDGDGSCSFGPALPVQNEAGHGPKALKIHSRLKTRGLFI